MKLLEELCKVRGCLFEMDGVWPLKAVRGPGFTSHLQATHSTGNDACMCIGSVATLYRRLRSELLFIAACMLLGRQSKSAGNEAPDQLHFIPVFSTWEESQASFRSKCDLL